MTKRSFAKRLLALVVAVIFVLSLVPGVAVQAAHASNEIIVTIDGVRVNFPGGQGPVIINGRTLVPVRGVFEHLGFTVNWERDTQRAGLMRPCGQTIVLTIGSDVFTTDSVRHNLDVPAQIINGLTKIPIRAVLESLGYSVEWLNSTRTVAISTTPRENAAPPVATPPPTGPGNVAPPATTPSPAVPEYVPPTIPEPSTTHQGNFALRNQAGRYLAIVGGQLNCSPNMDNNIWYLQHTGRGSYFIYMHNPSTNRRIDLWNNFDTAGTLVQMFGGFGHINAQMWYIVPNGDGTYRISTSNPSRMAITANNGAQPTIAVFDGLPAQSWTLVQATPVDVLGTATNDFSHLPIVNGMPNADIRSQWVNAWPGLTTFESYIFQFINDYRVANGLPRLQLCPVLSALAWYRTSYLNANGFVRANHQTRDVHTWGSHSTLGLAGHGWQRGGGAIFNSRTGQASHYLQARVTVDGWISSTGHRDIMLMRSTHMGIGSALSVDGTRTYAYVFFRF